MDKSHFYTDLATGKMATATTTTLRQGDKGQQVKVLQKLLGELTLDGSFGAKMKATVEAYQTKNKLPWTRSSGLRPGIT